MSRDSSVKRLANLSKNMGNRVKSVFDLDKMSI